MTPGPTYVYRCPNCDNLISRGSVSSGNTLDIRVYSDGRRIAPMMPQFPSITRCKKCNNFFWIRDAAEVAWYEPGQVVKFEWLNAQQAYFLTVYEYAEALNKQFAANLEEEKYIRIRIWRGFNDRVREGGELFTNSDDERLWKDNIHKLLSLLDPEDDNQKLIMAELHRNYGHFDECLGILNFLDHPEMTRVIAAIRKECEAQRTLVFQLNG